MAVTKLSESEALIVHTVKPQMAALERIWPNEFTSFDPERFEKQVKLALVKQPTLVYCEPASIVEALVQCAELGLDPSGTLGSAYLVPFKTKASLIIGYRGLRDLAQRTGAVKAANAYVVYEKDVFDYSAGRLPKHKPYIPAPEEEQNPGPVRCAWAYVTLTGGGQQETVMTLRELEKIRARSRAQKGPWHNEDDVPEMYRKTVLRRALKYVPMSPNRTTRLLERAFEVDEAAETVEADTETSEAQPASSNGATRTAAKLGLTQTEEGQA